MNADNLSNLLQELGYEPPENLKVNSKGKPYVVELNSDTNMGFAILKRLCDNDIAGAMFGGTVGVLVMCLLQINSENAE